MVHVAAGVVRDRAGRVLLARRHADTHQGGKWEFPGGKLEPGEPVLEGLRRELREELGIHLLSASPLICVAHEYKDRSVLLDTWVVVDYRGEPRGREGQPLAWVLPEDLRDYPMPAADRPIITAIDLPERFSLRAAPALDPGGRQRVFQMQLGTRSETLHIVDTPAARHPHRRQERPNPWVACRVTAVAALERCYRTGLDFLLLDAALHEMPERISPGIGLPVYLLSEPGALDPNEVRAKGAQGVAELRH